MADEIRTVSLDPELGVEAYRFQGIMQEFPNHFHDYYAIGLIERGCRRLTVRERDFRLGTGDFVLLHPREVHACRRLDEGRLDYRCINVSPEVMKNIARKVLGEECLPRFAEPVLYRSKLALPLHELHTAIQDRAKRLGKEELLLFLFTHLLHEHTENKPCEILEDESPAIKGVFDHLETHFAENVTLDELSVLTGLSKYHLLRSFTKQKGISPYSCLQTIRVGKAKKLLEQGSSPLETAFLTGFGDQSHLTNVFKKLIGLTPGQYMKRMGECHERS